MKNRINDYVWVLTNLKEYQKDFAYYEAELIFLKNLLNDNMFNKMIIDFFNEFDKAKIEKFNIGFYMNKDKANLFKTKLEELNFDFNSLNNFKKFEFVQNILKGLRRRFTSFFTQIAPFKIVLKNSKWFYKGELMVFIQLYNIEVFYKLKSLHYNLNYNVNFPPLIGYLKNRSDLLELFSYFPMDEVSKYLAYISGRAIDKTRLIDKEVTEMFFNISDSLKFETYIKEFIILVKNEYENFLKFKEFFKDSKNSTSNEEDIINFFENIHIKI